MGHLEDDEFEAALERGRIARQCEPRATSARYDRESGRIIVELTNGCTFAWAGARFLETASSATFP